MRPGCTFTVCMYACMYVCMYVHEYHVRHNCIITLTMQQVYQSNKGTNLVHYLTAKELQIMTNILLFDIVTAN